MFSFLKSKKLEHPAYESVAKNTFTRDNLFVHCIRELTKYSPGKKRLLQYIHEVEQDVDYTKEIYVHALRTNTEIFTINDKSKDYLKKIIDTSYLIDKCSSIIHSNSKNNADYLMNELVDVVYLLKELDSSLFKGVPLDHQRVIDAVFTVHELLEEKLNVYFQLSTESLSREIQIAKQMRLEYQDRKKTFHLVLEKQSELVTA